MMINDTPKSTKARCEMKVRLPVDLHLRLHAMKIHHGIRIADTIALALEEYLRAERAPADEAAERERWS